MCGKLRAEYTKKAVLPGDGSTNISLVLTLANIYLEVAAGATFT